MALISFSTVFVSPSLSVIGSLDQFAFVSKKDNIGIACQTLLGPHDNLMRAWMLGLCRGAEVHPNTLAQQEALAPASYRAASHEPWFRRAEPCRTDSLP